MNGHVTPLMCVEVAAIVPPSHQAFLRCAGSVGDAVYEEVVARGKASMYIERRTTRTDGSAITTDRMPTTFPLSHRIKSSKNTLVITHVYFDRSDEALNDLDVRPIHRLKYVGGGREVEEGLLWNTRLGKGFRKLKSIELCGVENVRHIPDHALRWCDLLESVDLSPFKNVTSIGDSFLGGSGGNTSLTSIDLSPFHRVKEIGSHFIAWHSSLTAVDLSPLRNVTSVGDGFMMGWLRLSTIDISPLSNITTLTNRFLYFCKSLKSIDLSAFRNVTSIGFEFLADCSSLTSIDLSPLSNVTEVGKKFMSGTAITSIDLAAFSKITTINDGFLSFCKSLISIDITPLRNVTTIKSFVLSHCTSLTSIDFTPLGNVTSIGMYFMNGCTSLADVDLSPLVKLTDVLASTFMGSVDSENVDSRKSFEKALKNRIKSNIYVVAQSTDARKKEVKTGGKKKK